MKRNYAGLFLVAMATVMYEVLLTRIFSVTMWYHFAFMAISVAMFGMTLAAVLVYLRAHRFPIERRGDQLGWASLGFSVSVVLSFLIHVDLPFVLSNGQSMSPLGHTLFISLTFLFTLVPFVFSGVVVTLSLAGSPGDVGRLYAADLIGAAIGCLTSWALLSLVDGSSAVFTVAAIACAAAFCFAPRQATRLRRRAVLGVSLFAVITIVGAVRSSSGQPLIPLRWTKGAFESPPLYETWNSFSRVQVRGNPALPEPPFGWGLSPAFQRAAPPVHQAHLIIDAAAATPLTAFDGDLSRLDHLKHDVTNMAHNLRSNADVLVVGVGGGRDLLSALAFKQASVLGVEMNGDILRTLNGRFGDLTGHLDRHPQITMINDEARSYVARTQRRFDIIQVSLVDTWAATAAGAFVLTENALYTVEAWSSFLGRLKPGGILTFSRWYKDGHPIEAFRMTALASEALRRQGVSDPRAHILLVRVMFDAVNGGAQPEGVGTILVGQRPFTAQEVAQVRQRSAELGFEVVLDPQQTVDPIFARVASGRPDDDVIRNYPLDLSAPTDDNPFFFHTLRLSSAFDQALWSDGQMNMNLHAVLMLFVLLLMVLGLTVLAIIVPLRRSAVKPSRAAIPLFIYFIAIGAGFMLIEMAQMQRLNIFLGHPTYALSTVLFTLLLSSGLGSALSATRWLAARPSLALTLLVLALAAGGALTPRVIGAAASSETWVRLLVAAAILFPMGLFMGTAFPFGMKWTAESQSALRPWLWGVNGAASVTASVLAVVLSLSWGISASFWIGVACYVTAAGVFWSYCTVPASRLSRQPVLFIRGDQRRA